jgi:hypothetical protein
LGGGVGWVVRGGPCLWFEWMVGGACWERGGVY